MTLTRNQDKEFIVFCRSFPAVANPQLENDCRLENITAGHLYIDDRFWTMMSNSKDRDIAMASNYALYPT
jgi:hypothetical protein